ncbi:hypothetical protein CHY_0842 [Carboxydothermus hydrogenoformans Z-2901]|uniref:Uncharacterized protein n=2 Tax=Carboxydothermus hydrogenoformans TaxID=129958 RepID=Q3ADU0_CARHZ|nr:hypothetical protein CHY_0842 [Carboxydothermus hydrogenoformans Z-2901]
MKNLSIPRELYIPVTLAIYEGISRAIDENNPKAKDLVKWYIGEIGVSGKFLVEKLEKKGIKTNLPAWAEGLS